MWIDHESMGLTKKQEPIETRYIATTQVGSTLIHVVKVNYKMDNAVTTRVEALLVNINAM